MNLEIQTRFDSYLGSLLRITLAGEVSPSFFSLIGFFLTYKIIVSTAVVLMNLIFGCLYPGTHDIPNYVRWSICFYSLRSTM